MKLLSLIIWLSLSLSTSSWAVASQKPVEPTSKLLTKYLEFLSEKHKVFAENVANSNTPGYKTKEVAGGAEFGDLFLNSNSGHMASQGVSLKVTSARHIRGKGLSSGSGGRLPVTKAKTTQEIKLNGNNVSIADEMAKMAKNNDNYQAALKAHNSTTGLISAVLGDKN